MKRIFNLACAVMLGAGCVQSISAAATDGSASFTVTFLDPAGNYNRRVDAFWITDAANKFIKNVRKDAAKEQGYLTYWGSVRANATVATVDGYSGATIATWTPVTVTWNCRDTNNVVMPDGTYKFWVEFTDHNGAGWYTTNGLAFTKGTAASTNTYPNAGPYLTAMSVVYTPAAAVHDLAVTAVTPNTAQADTNVVIQVVVTNRTANAESFPVTLSNLTTATLIGTQSIGSLAGNQATNVAFVWNTANLEGNYVFRATAGPVAGEAGMADNSLDHTVAVQAVAHDVAVTSLTPSLVAPNTDVSIAVGVANRTANPESFSVVLSNLTTGSLIGTETVNLLAGNTTTTVAFPWSTANLSGDHSLLAVAGPVAGEVATADNSLIRVVAVRPLIHDVGIAGVAAPTIVSPDSLATITVTVTNAGETAETFDVRLFDDTDAQAIGASWQVTNLAPAAALTLPFTWDATNATLGYHSLRAVAQPVAGETALSDNTNRVQVAVATGLTNQTLVARGSTWRFNDQGLDLTHTPWRAPDYYDAVWSQGAAPLGYSSDNQLTNLATQLGWGPDSANKHPACYFRQRFYADALPALLTLNVRCVDGVVVYLNGVELARFNMSSGGIIYTDRATSPVAGADRDAYLSASVSPTHVVPGANVLAAEVHRADLAGADLAFDLELLGSAPQAAPDHRVDAVAVSGPADGVLGDRMPVTVTVTNRGNLTESVVVVLKNNTTGQIIGTRTLAGVVPGGSATAGFDWGTLGAGTGANILSAYTVVGGVTNLAGAFTTSADLASGFSTNAVNAAASFGGRCTDVATTGNLLLVGAGATLEVYSRTNASAPVKLGAVRLPGMVRSLAVKDTRAFVACGSAGVAFVDVSSPSRPVQRSWLNTSGNAYSVAASGKYVYVADGVAGVRIVNASSLAAPALEGAYYTPGPACAVVVADSRAYVLDQHEGLLILDVSNPKAPSLLGAYSGFAAGQALAVSGSYAYLVDGNNHLAIVKVSNPSAPSLAGSLVLPGVIGQGLAVNGGRVYVGAGAAGLLTINATTPSAAQVVSTIPMPGEAGDLALANSRLYVANGLAGFQIFSLSTPTQPALAADFPTAVRAADVAIANNRAYVAAGESGLRILDLTNSSPPVLLSRFTAATNARAVAVSGTRVYVGDGQYGLKIVNVDNPSVPVLLGSYAQPELGNIRDVGVSGSLVVVSDGRTILLLDASTPGAPVLRGSYQTPAFAFGLAVANSRAYLACGNAGLVILQMSGNSLTHLATLQLPSLASGVVISGASAYVAGPASGWWRVDVSDPSFPVLAQSSSAQGPILDLAVSGTNLTLVTLSHLGLTLNLSTPLTPVPTQFFGPLARAHRLTVNSSWALMAEDEAGLSLFAIAGGGSGQDDDDDDDPPPPDGDGDPTPTLADLMAAASQVPGSAIMLAVPPTPNDPTIGLSWYSETGRSYTIYRSTDLNAGFTVFKDNILATPPINFETDTNTAGAAFYVIGVR